MRAFLATTVLLGLALFGFTSLGRGVSAQGPSILNAGQLVAFRYLDGRTDGCWVLEVRGDFVQCKVEPSRIGQKIPERWYNLRLVMTIDKPATQE